MESGVLAEAVGEKALCGCRAMGHWKQEGDKQQLQSSSLGLYEALPHVTFTATHEAGLMLPLFYPRGSSGLRDVK